MTMTALKQIDPDTFTDQDRVTFAETSRSLSRLRDGGCVRVEADVEGKDRQTFVLPAAAVQLLTEALMHLGNGRSVTIMPSELELTTQQAADMLNVSRPYLVKLLDDGKMPFHMAGTHRRIRLNELSAYRRHRDDQSRRALEELAAEAQELDFGY